MSDPNTTRRERAPRAFEAPPREETTLDLPDEAGSGDGEPAHHLPGRRGLRWGALLASSVTALVAIAVTMSVTQMVEQLFAREDWLGWTALGLAGIAGIAALALIVKEVTALMRLSRIGSIRETAERTLRHDDSAGADETVRALSGLYGHRRDMAWALGRLKRFEGEIIDPADRVRLAERELMGELDAEAGRLIAAAAKRISLLTALTPAAALDLLFVAAQNLTLLRRLAALYGGRPGSLGTLKLARMVVTHLAVTGGVALSDTLIQHVVGRGIAGRLSARIGEGTVNGIMTARIGLAALDLVRPLPFETLEKPRLSAIAARLTRSTGAPQAEADDDGTERRPQDGGGRL